MRIRRLALKACNPSGCAARTRHYPNVLCLGIGEKLMSYAIIRTGGKQFPVTAGETIRVPSIEGKAGDKVDIETLVAGEGAKAKIGEATLKATVVGHGRGEKVIVFKKK